MTPSGRTRVFAILGDPVAHSLSPAMHNAAFRMLGLDAVYVALRTSPEGVGGLMRSLAAAGGGGNVTVPYKFTAAEQVDEMHGALPEACNTFWADGDRLVGDNTDVTGVLDALAALEAPATSWL
ncbi:MAG: shikimate dehydrogenase, partial [Gemmatimonadota bacterium]